jgi:hypothetical protein
MTRRAPKKDLVDKLSEFIAYHKGVPVLAGIGLAGAGLILTLIPGVSSSIGFWGWLARSHLFLYLGVIVGLLGILVGDAL